MDDRDTIIVGDAVDGAACAAPASVAHAKALMMTPMAIAAISLLSATITDIDRVSDIAGVLAQLVSGIVPLSAGSAASGIVVHVSPSGFDADWSKYARPARGLILTMALRVVYVLALSMKWRRRSGVSSV
jgi:hypothetical protein